MRAFLAKVPPTIRFLLALPVLGIAYPLVMTVIPAIIHAAMPDVVRSVLSLI